MKSRGYNQSEWIAKGIASILKVELNTNSLIRNVDNVSQTKKSRYDRHTNTDGIFSINDINLFERKHVLLVDDIMTTGSTLIACSELFKNIPGVRISFFTLAIAD
jgi:predicted amidophosphoribosyltransferase